MTERRNAADKLKGKAKEKAGEVSGDDRMAGEGRADQAKGKARETVDEAKDKARGVRDSLREQGEERGSSDDGRS